ncbi:50S ribosomal protein L18Ae [Candidatus Methanoperedenaceae archaeon GB50]|nr:50S ribosomal protein L18Ae [Candidatus Methanoperedenaceae archaeon GB50]CAD7781351.1 MAG: 50S ribosomal protein L18Ae [Candidatus Methanoperedenaceae archaeon GB50]
MSEFIVKGSFKADDGWRVFTKTISSNNEKNAVEKTYSLFGSKHRLKRNSIRIESVSEVGA